MKQRRSSRGPGDHLPRIAQELPLSAEDVPPDPNEPPGSLWGDIGVLAGGAVIGASLYAGHPYLGAGVFGRWRIAGIAIGLLAVSAGLVVLVHHRVWQAAIKTAVVGVTVTAVGAFAFFGVEQVPTTLHGCWAVEEPTLESTGPVFCRNGDGLLTRISIDSVSECGASVTYETRQENGEWWWTGAGVGCKL